MFFMPPSSSASFQATRSARAIAAAAS